MKQKFYPKKQHFQISNEAEETNLVFMTVGNHGMQCRMVLVVILLVFLKLSFPLLLICVT